MHYSAIQPSLECTKRMISEVKASMKPLAVLKEALETRYKELELTLGSSQQQVLVNLYNNYISMLIKNLDRRFTEAAPVLGAFSIFNLTTLPAASEPQFSEYGVANVKILAGQFQLSEDQMVVQWQNFKYLMLSWKPPQNMLQGNNSKLSPTKWLLRKVVKEQALLKESYSFLVNAVKIVLDTTSLQCCCRERSKCH